MNIVLIGSRRGIGLHLKNTILAAGHSVWGMSRQAQASSERFTPIVGNIHVEGAYPEIPESIDGLIYCAGSQGPIGPAMQLDVHEWFLGIRDNLLGAFNAVHLFHSRLLRHRSERAKAILFSGGGAVRARPNLSAYACAKVGIVRLVETLAEEWHGGKIDINAIAPGAILTDMTREILNAPEALTGAKEKQDALTVSKQDNERALLEVSDCILWMLSAESDGVSGKLISAKWDAWRTPSFREQCGNADAFTLRRKDGP